MFRFYAAVLLAFLTGSGSALAADYPEPKHGQWIAKDFKFHTGEVLPELKLHYTTVGAPTGQPVEFTIRKFVPSEAIGIGAESAAM